MLSDFIEKGGVPFPLDRYMDLCGMQGLVTTQTIYTKGLLHPA